MPSFLAPAAPAGLRPGARPSFSVVIPAYQAAAKIGEAIESALSQTLPPAEVLVCDDGSTDALEEALAPHRSAVVLLREDHRGVAAARNALLRAATGDFIVPLDADDIYAPTRLQRLADLAVARPDLDLLATDANLVSEGTVVARFGAMTPFAADRQREEIIDRCFLLCPAMRRERLLAIGGYDESLHSAEDWDCCIRLIHAGATAGLVDEPLLDYRLGSASLTAHRSETLLERVRIFEKALADQSLSPAERRAAQHALSRSRGRAVQRLALEAVGQRSPETRRRLLSVARSTDVPRRARIGALLATVVPSRSHRILDATLADSTGRPRLG